MAEPDCGLCALAGYRSCDRCGGVVFTPSPLGIDLCGYCRQDGPGAPARKGTGAGSGTSEVQGPT
jgi:hypothetical protein